MPLRQRFVHSQGRWEAQTWRAEERSSESLISLSGRMGSSGERWTPRPTGMPGTTALTHPHQCPPFLQVKSTKPLTDGFSWTINAQAGFLVTPLIPLLSRHKQSTDLVMLTFMLRGKLNPRNLTYIIYLYYSVCNISLI